MATSRNAQWRAAVLALVGSLMLAAPALGDITSSGVLEGKVIDNETKGPLGGVEVLVTSPAMQDAKLVKTDASGYYRVPNLPPGLYYIQFDKDGYISNGIADVAVRSVATLRVDAPLVKGGVEKINITSKPNVDVGSSSSGTTLSSDFMKRVPLSAPGGKGAGVRSFEAVALAAPGTTADNYGTSVNGATSPENAYAVDGLSVGNPAKGTLGTQLSSEFLEEVNVVTSGYLPEYGRTTGGVLNVTTKSGSNELHGQIFSYFSPGALEGNRKQVKLPGQPVQYRSKLGYIADIGFDLGGPIIKDKLWFYTGFDISKTVYDVDRGIYRSTDQLDEFGHPKFEDDSIYSQKYQADSRTIAAIAKLTWAVHPDHRLTLSMFASPFSSGGGAKFDGQNVTGGSYGINPLTGRPQYEDISTPGTYSTLATQESSVPIDVNAKWTSEYLEKRLLLDVAFGFHQQYDNTRAPDGSSAESGPEGLGRYARVEWARAPNLHSIADFENLPPEVVAKCMEGGVNRCLVGAYRSGGPEFLQDATYRRYHGSAVVTFLASLWGHHLIKAGFDTEWLQFKNVKSNRVLQEGGDGSFFDDSANFGVLPAPDMPVPIAQLRKDTKSLIVGGFLQDSWSVMDKVTVNVGLRYDAQYFMDRGKTVLSLPNQWSPRLGLIYDPTQQGKAKLFANYARYYQTAPLDFADVALVGEPQLYGGHKAANCNPAILAQQLNECQAPASLQAGQVHPPGLPNKVWGVSGTTTAIDPAIEASSSDEISAGGEYELMADARVGLNYTRRWVNKWIEDMVANVGLPGFDANPGYGLGAFQPKVKRDYDAFTLFFLKSFSNKWLAQASYRLAWLRGNYSGFIASEDNFLGPSFSAAYDNQYLMTNREGPLPGDNRHTIKLLGARDWSILPTQNLGTGLVMRAQSGGATSHLGNDQHSYENQIYILPRGSGERLPWQFGADVQLAYRIAFSRGFALAATVDVFNVFNFQAATAVDEAYTYRYHYPVDKAARADLDSGKLVDNEGKALNDKELANKSFGQARVYQAPLIVRFGLRGQF